MKRSNSNLTVDQIPSFYLEYLKADPNPIVNGLPLFGLNKSESEYDLISANSLFSFIHPSLSKDYLAIRFYEGSALLLKKKPVNKKDGKLFEIKLEDGNGKVVNLGILFSDYIRKTSQWDENRDETLEIIKGLIIENKQKNKDYDRASKQSKVKFKARDWKIVRSAVHDLIVALVAYKYNEQLNSMEVAAFLATDHPNYEPGHGIKAALNMLFSAAFKSGSSLEIRFVNISDGRKKAQIPLAVVEFAKECNIQLDEAKSIIRHEVGLKLYSCVSGVSSDLEKTLENTKSRNGISLQGLCFLSNLRIWETHEIKFVMENVSKPEGLLFGKDLPENWGSFEVSLQYGRNVIAATKFRAGLENLLDEFVGKSIIESVGDYFTIKTTQAVSIDITIQEELEEIEADREYILIPRVRRFYLESEIDDDLRYASSHASDERASIIIYSLEVKNYPHLFDKFKHQTNSIIIVLPLITNELDDEVIKRMKRARLLRA